MAEKLIRDKYITKLSIGSWRLAEPEEMVGLLRRKYWEEMNEVLMSRGRKELIDELADVTEVAMTLDLWRPYRPWRWWLLRLVAFISRVDKDAIETARIRKRKSKGGFHKGVILIKSR